MNLIHRTKPNVPTDSPLGSLLFPYALAPSLMIISSLIFIQSLLPTSSWALGTAQRHREQIPEVESSPISEETQSNWGTHHEEIVRWQDLSDQYVLGYGIDPETKKEVPFAVYDKTMTNASYPLFWRYLVLGAIGISDFNLGFAYQHFERSRIHSNQKLLEQHNAAKPVPFYLDTHEIILSGDFWRSSAVIWKNGKQPDPNGPSPKIIAFKDLDWAKMNQKLSLLNKVFATLRTVGNQETLNELGLDKTQILDIEFELQPDGTYHSVHDQQDDGIKPAKIIDLRRKESSLKYALAWGITINCIKGGINGIPIFGPPQIVVALLDRIFDFVELLYLHHHAQALHLVSEAMDGNKNSPFSTSILTEENLSDALFYLLRSQTMISAMIKNSFVKKELLVPNYTAIMNSKRNTAIEDLKKRGLEIYPIPNTFFAVGFKKDPETQELTKLKIYALGYPKLGRNKPHAVVDFVHPNRELFKREFLQSIAMISNFIPNLVPGVGSAVKLLYKEIVVREYHRRQMWENGYLAHMHYSPHELKNILINEVGLTEEQAREYENEATHLIEDRRLNPVDLTSDQIPLLRDQVEKWIISHDPNYIPIH